MTFNIRVVGESFRQQYFQANNDAHVNSAFLSVKPQEMLATCSEAKLLGTDLGRSGRLGGEIISFLPLHNCH